MSSSLTAEQRERIARNKELAIERRMAAKVDPGAQTTRYPLDQAVSSSFSLGAYPDLLYNPALRCRVLFVQGAVKDPEGHGWWEPDTQEETGRPYWVNHTLEKTAWLPPEIQGQHDAHDSVPGGPCTPMMPASPQRATQPSAAHRVATSPEVAQRTDGYGTHCEAAQPTGCHGSSPGEDPARGSPLSREQLARIARNKELAVQRRMERKGAVRDPGGCGWWESGTQEETGRPCWVNHALGKTARAPPAAPQHPPGGAAALQRGPGSDPARAEQPTAAPPAGEGGTAGVGGRGAGGRGGAGGGGGLTEEQRARIERNRLAAVERKRRREAAQGGASAGGEGDGDEVTIVKVTRVDDPIASIDLSQDDDGEEASEAGETGGGESQRSAQHTLPHDAPRDAQAARGGEGGDGACCRMRVPTRAVGVSFNVAEPETMRALTLGCEATLRRDPGNANDPNAIEVFAFAHHTGRIGFVPRHDAALLAPALDAARAPAPAARILYHRAHGVTYHHLNLTVDVTVSPEQAAALAARLRAVPVPERE